MYNIIINESALADLLHLKKTDQRLVLDAIDLQLQHDPLTPTRNRKPLRPNELSEWELRIDQFRVFYDVASDNDTVTIKAIGWKEHNTLYIGGKEFTL